MPSMKPYLKKRPLPPVVRRRRAARVSAALVANPRTPARLIAERDRFHRQVVSVRGKTGDYIVQFKTGDRRFSNRDSAEQAMLAAIRRGDKPMLFLAVKLPDAVKGQVKGHEVIWTYPSLLNTEGTKKMNANPSPAAQARPIVQEVLRMHGLSNKFTIKKTSFSGFGYGDGYFVTIEGWKPDRELGMRVKVFILEKLSVIRLPSPDEDHWVVEFKGPGIVGNPRRNIAFAEPTESETVEEFKVFPPTGGMIATDTYETGVNWPPFQFVEAYARKGKLGLIAFGAYNAFGLIGPEQGGVAVVQEKPVKRVIGTIVIPYSRKKRLAMFKQIFSEINWPWGAKNAGFEMRYMPNPGANPEWYGTTGRAALRLTLKQALSVSGPGRADKAVAALVRTPSVAAQLARISPDAVRQELREYGAWDDSQLADHEANLRRWVWIVGNDIAEEHKIARRHNPGIDPVEGAYRATPRRGSVPWKAGKGMKKCPGCGAFVDASGLCFRCQHPEIKRPSRNPGGYTLEWSQGPAGTVVSRRISNDKELLARLTELREVGLQYTLYDATGKVLETRRAHASKNPGFSPTWQWEDWFGAFTLEWEKRSGRKLSTDPSRAKIAGWAKQDFEAKLTPISSARMFFCAKNPGQSYHKREARRYAKMLKGDLKAGHRDAAEYWQGALSAEAASVAVGGVVRNPMTKKREEWQRRFTRLLMKRFGASVESLDLKKVFRMADKLYMEGFSATKAVATAAFYKAGLGKVGGNPLTWFHVYLGNKLIDAIPVGDKMSVEDMRRSLIEHDGYDHRIRVVKTRTAVKRNPGYDRHAALYTQEMSFARAAFREGERNRGYIHIGKAEAHTDSAREARDVQGNPYAVRYSDAKGEHNVVFRDRRSFERWQEKALRQGTKYFRLQRRFVGKDMKKNPLLMVVPNPRRSAMSRLHADDPKAKYTACLLGPSGQPLYTTGLSLSKAVSLAKSAAAGGSGFVTDARGVVVWKGPLPNPSNLAYHRMFAGAAREASEARKLGVPEQHQLRIALKTLKMTPAMAGIMGGMSIPEAKAFLKRVGYSDQQIAKLSQNPTAKARRARRSGARCSSH